MNEGKYIYSIVNGKENKSFGPIGINNREVNLVPAKDVAAVVSSSPIINFDRLDRKELTKYVASHQKVQEELMKDYDVCPMTFGIIAPSISEVSRILERAYLQFKTALEKIEGKAEFVVQIWWDKEGLLSEVLPINPESLRKVYIKDMQDILRDIAYDSALNKLIDEDMLANFSFLIEKVKESELDTKMQDLGEKYEGKLRFKYIGPMPPYSFVQINLSLGNFELVDEARKLLRLDEEATFDEIKKSYYELSHQYHPDRASGKEEQMKKIARAHSILENYCQGFRKKEKQRYSFREKDVKDSIMIKKVGFK